MCTAALFTTTKTWKQPNCPVTDEGIKMQCVYKIHTHTHTEDLYFHIILSAYSLAWDVKTTTNKSQNKTEHWTEKLRFFKWLTTETVLAKDLFKICTGSLVCCLPFEALPSLVGSLKVADTQKLTLESSMTFSSQIYIFAIAKQITHLSISLGKYPNMGFFINIFHAKQNF